MEQHPEHNLTDQDALLWFSDHTGPPLSVVTEGRQPTRPVVAGWVAGGGAARSETVTVDNILG